jgi:hypothetical protein
MLFSRTTVSGGFFIDSARPRKRPGDTAPHCGYAGSGTSSLANP